MLTRIQILRAVAAYAVVLHHWSLEIANNTEFNIPGSHAGAAGVDLFFVISGFVMVYVAGRRDGPGRFMFDRIARIVPLYWLATLGVLAAIAFRPWLFTFSHVSPETIASSLLFAPSFNTWGVLQPIHYIGWTLNFEMAFYALFALAMFAKPAWRVMVALVLIALLYILGLLAPDTHVLSFYGDPILFEFAAGCVLGWLVVDEKRLAAMARIPGWIYVAAGVALFVINENLPDLVNNRLVRWGLPAALIVLGIVVLDLTRPRARKGLLVALGDASYSAYLLHLFVVIVVAQVLLPVAGTSALGVALTFPAVVGGTALISAVSYKLIEIPARDLLRRLLPKRPTPAAAESR